MDRRLLNLLAWAPILAGAMLLFSGCAPHYARYSVELADVIQPHNTVASYGAVQIGESKVECSNDQFLAAWSFGWSSIDVEFTNLTDDTLWIIWDECVFVDPDGVVHHLIPSEIRYRDVFETVKPAKIPAGCKAAARLVPRDNIRLHTSGWTELPYLPKQSRGDHDLFRERVLSYLGKNLQVLLAIYADGQDMDYRFVFEIVDAGVLKGTVESGGSAKDRQL